MANPAYPTTPKPGVNSKRTLRDGRQEDVGSDGSIRIRKLYADKYDFEIVYPALKASEVSTVESFYGTYSASTAIDLYWPETAATYVVRFGKDAINRKWVGPGLREVTVKLVGV